MTYLLAAIGIFLALMLASRSQRKADDDYQAGMDKYYRKMREIHAPHRRALDPRRNLSQHDRQTMKEKYRDRTN